MHFNNFVLITAAVFVAVSFGASTPTPTRAPTAAPTSSAGKACQYSYECSGNTICDGASCTGSFGLVLDSSVNRLAYGATCTYSTGPRYTLRTVNASGGIPDVSPVAFTNANVRRVVGYRAGDIYFDETRPDGTHAYYRTASTLNILLATTTAIPTFYTFQGYAEIDAAGNTYNCQSDSTGNFIITRDTGVLGSQTVPVPEIIYNLGPNRCGPIRAAVNSDKLYISYIVGTKTSIFQGNTGCSNCTVSDRPYLAIADVVNDFDVSDKYLFYGTAKGLFRDNITTISAPVKISAENILGVDAGPSGSKVVYFTNSLGGVFSTPVDINPNYPAATGLAQKVPSTCKVTGSA